ncbi:NAD(P)H-hydrate dehydratase [Oscillospiraceae bacterium HV4-5-C5C]|nr:NAD(P)H-hydrate dehydratase [Oscillospiraceae bacterium HV4-5-C5C]
MRTLGKTEQRTLDRLVSQDSGLPALLLMEGAARAVAEYVTRVLKPASGSTIAVCCGRGNNGGDGYAAARLLLACGDYQLQVYETAAAAGNQGDAAINRQAWLQMGRLIQPLEQFKLQTGLVIDAVFGSGFTCDRPLDPVLAGWSQKLEAGRADGRYQVLAVDIPSGVEAGTGKADPHALHADVTLSFFYAKTGCYAYPGRDLAGLTVVSELGLPQSYLDRLARQAGLQAPEVITREDLVPWAPARPAESHKGSFGKCLLWAGSPGMGGAAVLALQAALRSGVGYTKALIPESLYAAALTACPSALIQPLSEQDGGAVDPSALQVSLKDGLSWCDSCLAGPGLGQPAEPDTRQARWEAMENLTATAPRLVLDADALNMLAARGGAGRELLQSRFRSGLAPAVLTPHPGEYQRLCPEGATLVRTDRLKAAKLLSDLTGAVVVLKGAGTIVAFPQASGRRQTEPDLPANRLWINSSGNPAQAKAGSGDILAGLLAGLLAQPLPLWQAVLAAVFLHGSAADLAAGRQAGRAVLPGDTLDTLGLAFRSCKWQ